jgi:hypothetical protein
MKERVAKLFVFGMAVTFFLLAYQAEPISAGFGYFFGIVLSIAILFSFAKVERRD